VRGLEATYFTLRRRCRSSFANLTDTRRKDTLMGVEDKASNKF
jgi:hypothetical protein